MTHKGEAASIRLAARTCAAALLALLGGAVPARGAGPLELPYVTPQPADVLGLFDSTEDPHNARVVLGQRAKDALAHLGLRLELRDVNQGLPPDGEMRRYRAVVTAYDDAAMRGALAYVKWLRAQIAAGRRVVVLNNFGAYREAGAGADGGWLDNADVNLPLRELGVSYDGEWTDNSKLLAIRDYDPAVFRTRPDLSTARHYYRFRVTRPDVDAHLLLERTDIPEGRSAVVLTSPRGGMAIERYYEDAAGEELVDLRRFLARALFPGPDGTTRVLFVVDPGTPEGQRMEAHLGQIVRYSRLRADFMRARDLAGLTRADLARWASLVLATSDAAHLRGDRFQENVEDWVREDGGGLVALFPVRVPRWDRMLGIRSFAGKPAVVPGLRYVRTFFPGYGGLFVRGGGYSAELRPVRLAEDAVVYAVGADPKRPTWEGPPALWARRHGRGRMLYRADHALSGREWRGSVLQMVLQSMPASAVPVLGLRVMFVDDFPQPMFGVLRDPVAREYRLTDTDFFHRVLWPDLVGLAKDTGTPLTFGLVFNFDRGPGALGSGPFFAPEARGVPAWMAREALRLGHEVAFHGLCHAPLELGSAAPAAPATWQSPGDMVVGLRIARKEWEALFGLGHAPFTYTAPEDRLDSAGKDALRRVFPEIRVLAGAYTAGAEAARPDAETESALMEMGTDPHSAHFEDLPRVSSGFRLSEKNNVALHDAAALLGVWTHVVRPHEIYDASRTGGHGWRTLREGLRLMVDHVTESYPWLAGMTAAKAHAELVRFGSNTFRYEVTSGAVVVRMSNGGGRFLLRLDPEAEVAGVHNARLVHAYPELGYYILESPGPVTLVSVTP